MTYMGLNVEQNETLVRRGSQILWGEAGKGGEQQCALRPAEVRAGILKAAPVVTVSQYGSRVSMSACEMMAEAWDRSSQADAVARELQQVLAERARQGVSITWGRRHRSGAGAH